MLQDSDLDTFLDLFRGLSTDPSTAPSQHPTEALRTDDVTDHLIQCGELTPLWNSLKVACASGDAPETAFYVFDRIVRSLDDKQPCADLTCTEAWKRAIRWACADVAASAPGVPLLHEGERRTQVGRACQRLRERAYRIPIRTYGPDIATDTKNMIVDKICGLVSRTGGYAVAAQLCTHMKSQNRIHDGLWIFGSPVATSFEHTMRPALPVGWLFSLAIRYFHAPSSSPDPAADWTTLVQLATDFAACMDCQRYTHFDAIHLGAHDFIHVLSELLEWREVFSLPQTPAMTLTTLRQAFSSAQWPAASADHRRDVKRLLSEILRLLRVLDDADNTIISLSQAHRCYPLLWRYARAELGTANAGYREPLDAHRRNHDRFVLFEIGYERVVILPRPLTASAGCHVVFELIWKTLDATRAADLVGDTLETCIGIGCRGRADRVFTRETYPTGKDRLEIDVAAHSEGDFILFESKAKALTTKSRSGDFLTLLEDYTHSYLSLIRQSVSSQKELATGADTQTLSRLWPSRSSSYDGRSVSVVLWSCKRQVPSKLAREGDYGSSIDAYIARQEECSDSRGICQED